MDIRARSPNLAESDPTLMRAKLLATLLVAAAALAGCADAEEEVTDPCLKENLTAEASQEAAIDPDLRDSTDCDPRGGERYGGG